LATSAEARSAATGSIAGAAGAALGAGSVVATATDTLAAFSSGCTKALPMVPITTRLRPVARTAPTILLTSSDDMVRVSSLAAAPVGCARSD
jgi:hypothetical protein